MENNKQIAETDSRQMPARENIKLQKTKICRRCGTEYTVLYRECPSCGYNPAGRIISIVAGAVLTAALAVVAVLLLIRVGSLETRMNSVEAYLSDATGAADITRSDYYQQNLIYDGANLAAFGDGGDYLIYAMQQDCAACQEASEYIISYASYGYTAYCPLYFVTPESSETLFYDTLQIEATPTLLRMHGDTVLERKSGVDEVFTMLDELVSQAQAAEGDMDKQD